MTKKDKKSVKEVEEEIPEEFKQQKPDISTSTNNNNNKNSNDGVGASIPPPQINAEEIDDQVENGSRMAVLASLIRKLGLGSDLTQVTIPGAFILPKSTLTYFGEQYSAHFDVLLKANSIEDEKERMLQVFRYFTTTPRVVEDVTKKPLNPVLGETYQGQVPFTDEDGNTVNVQMLAEQISHHPPISCSTVYSKEAGISVSYHEPVRSHFLGTYVKLSFEGSVIVKLDKFNEVYTATCPSMAIRIFRSFSEYVGVAGITSNRSDYRIKAIYHPKPLLGGQYNSMEAKLYKGKEKLYKIKGQWNQELKISDYKKDDYQLFFRRKVLVPGELIVPQELPETDSSKVWGGLFEAAKTNVAKNITREKTKVEEEQRKKAAERKENGVEWKPIYFHQDGNNWILNQDQVKS